MPVLFFRSSLLSLFSCSSPSFFFVFIDFRAFRSREIKVHMGDLVQSIGTVFINPVIHTLYNYIKNGQKDINA